MSAHGWSRRGGISLMARGLGRVVDPERLRRILQRVSDDVGVLGGYASGSRSGLAQDPARLGHVKYAFLTAIEGCVSAAQHVCSSEGWGPPETNADAMSVLARHRVLTGDLGQAMAEAVRFRNLLVHQYAEVDDTRVLEHLDRLSDLEEFVAALSRLL